MSTQTVLQFDEPIRRPRARATDPDTSHEAAQSISCQDLTDLQRAVFHILRDFGPLTDPELASHYAYRRRLGIYTRRVGDSTLRSRRAELCLIKKNPDDKAMLVGYAGFRRGKHQVWKVV